MERSTNSCHCDESWDRWPASEGGLGLGLGARWEVCREKEEW